MKILVTGGLGFIGSHTAARLVAEGHDVHVLDNLHTGSRSNIAAMKVRATEGDAGKIAGMKGKFEAVIHLGTYSSSPMYLENPQLVARALADWLAVLDYARRNDSRLVFASSSSLYNGNEPPHREGMPIAVTDFYTEARYAMERLAELYHSLYSLPSAGLRYFSVYGPGERSKGRYANPISQFMWAMEAGEGPVLFGDGMQTRDFIHVDDAVKANLLALGCREHGIFNIGTGKAATFNRVVGLLNAELGTSIRPVYQPNRIRNYVAHTLADTSLAERRLGFRSSVSLEDGIRRLVASEHREAG
jgi:UDP-glucose 4-epimerase